MDLFVVFALLALAMHTLNSRDQRARVALLASYLGKYRVEKLMEDLTRGYLRALGEPNPERQAQIWHLLDSTEAELCEQCNAFVLEFARLDAAHARVSTLPVALPYAAQWLSARTFDLRKALGIHAHALQQATANSAGLAPKDKAYTLLAELFLMQHSCHWFCRSRMVASMRLLARHKTAYAQVLAAVAPQTRQAYRALVGT